jgi:hypothetical protein
MGIEKFDIESIPYRIRIGVTGHRKLDDPAAVEALVKKANNSPFIRLVVSIS